jgi:hypothetical protein
MTFLSTSACFASGTQPWAAGTAPSQALAEGQLLADRYELVERLERQLRDFHGKKRTGLRHAGNRLESRQAGPAADDAAARPDDDRE